MLLSGLTLTKHGRGKCSSISFTDTSLTLLNYIIFKVQKQKIQQGLAYIISFVLTEPLDIAFHRLAAP